MRHRRLKGWDIQQKEQVNHSWQQEINNNIKSFTVIISNAKLVNKLFSGKTPTI